MEKVSVIVATYRQEEKLKNALHSLSRQTYRNIEIVVVNDNGESEWNSKINAIVHCFRTEHCDIELKYIVNEPNQGSAKSRNIGIEAASGRYVTFLDDDDLYLSEKIKNQVEFMENEKLDYSVTDLELFNENDKLIDRRIRNYIKDTSSDSLWLYHMKYHITGTDTMMFTKEYLQKIGGFAPIDAGDEFYLMLRAIDGKGKFGYLPCCDIKAYVHSGENGLSSGEGKINGENALFSYKKKFFSKIDKKTRRYIRMRHYAVCAYAEIRRKRFVSFSTYAAKSFFCAPIQCVKLFFEKQL